jgi:hypothetical protein
VAARLKSDQPLAGGGTLKVVANPEVGCDSIKQKQVAVRSAGEHPLLRELWRHRGSYNLNGWEEKETNEGVLLSEVTSADPLDQPAVGHGGLFSSSISCFLGGMVGCIFRCLTPELSITGGSNIEIPSLFIFMGPRKERE